MLIYIAGFFWIKFKTSLYDLDDFCNNFRLVYDKNYFKPIILLNYYFNRYYAKGFWERFYGVKTNQMVSTRTKGIIMMNKIKAVKNNF